MPPARLHRPASSCAEVLTLAPTSLVLLGLGSQHPPAHGRVLRSPCCCSDGKEYRQSKGDRARLDRQAIQRLGLRTAMQAGSSVHGACALSGCIVGLPYPH